MIIIMIKQEFKIKMLDKREKRKEISGSFHLLVLSTIWWSLVTLHLPLFELVQHSSFNLLT